MHSLTEKTQRLAQLLAPFHAPEMEVFPSQQNAYRLRAEFRIWHHQQGICYAMSPQGEKITANNYIEIKTFPIAHQRIQQAMPILLSALNQQEILHKKLFQVEFLASLKGDLLITLIYHRKLEDNWQQQAQSLQTLLNAQIIGRSRKQKIVLNQDYIQENLTVFGKPYHYRQYEGAFSQPNGLMAEQMLGWALKQAKRIANQHTDDLLELYAGNGNFTLPLSSAYRRVLATEISKTSIKALRKNAQHNGCDNIQIARLSAAEFSSAYTGERVFKRLILDNIHLSDYAFHTILVDPPRAGIDAQTLNFMQSFTHILYISCNPNTLADNLNTLYQTHDVTQVALFDQFPHTPHIECGVLLKKRA